ncbi:MAG: double-strand break repair helicase AddA [Alphaproteobacteria bacterium]|nr:double-strand break repair helicase AddA [Alphaproteobacteria bacterium]
MPGATPEQNRASDPSLSAWVSANAGSGKTFVLVQRVLRLLLSGADPSKILCLTFTRAAAAEMYNRVFSHLRLWASARDEVLRAYLVDLDGQEPTAARLYFARFLLGDVLERVPGLRIRTVHSFCESLLRKFAFEAALPPHFQVMDESAFLELVVRVQKHFLMEDCLQPALCEAFDCVIAYVNERNFTELMQEVVSKRHILRRWIAREGDLDGALLSLRLRLDLDPEDTSETLHTSWFKSPLWEKREALRDLLCASSVASDRNQGARLAQACATKENEERYRAYRTFFLTDKNTLRQRLMSKALSVVHIDLANLLCAESCRLEGLIRRERALEIFTLTSSLLRLSVVFNDRYDILRRRCGLLSYDDLIDEALALLCGDGGEPSWVLYRLNRDIDHILIDEAQDMSFRQWRIVHALTSEIFAGEGAEGSVCSIFAVGDEKQSIYSFQGAVPEEFIRMGDFFGEQTRHAGKVWERLTLRLSFRSVPAVLGIVDAVFASSASMLAGCPNSHVKHETVRSFDPGLVELWPLEAMVPSDSQGADEGSDSVSLSGLDPVSGSPVFRLASSIASRISGLLHEGVLIEDGRERFLRPGDFLILLRKRDALFEAVITALHQVSLPVSGADRLVLTAHIAVRDLMAAGDIALFPEDDLVLAALLKSPLFGWSEADLFTIAHGRTGSLWSSLLSFCSGSPVFEKTLKRLHEWQKKATRLPPYEFFCHILGEEGGRLSLVERLGPEAGEAIDEFLSRALSYEDSHIPDLQGFLYWLRAQKVDIRRDPEPGRDEIRIMTVHGAKGLEAPVIILVDSCDIPGRSLRSPFLFLQRDGFGEGGGEFVYLPSLHSLEPACLTTALQRDDASRDAEYQRLLYVAMTRARDRLYVCGLLSGRRRCPPERSWYAQISRVVRELGYPVDKSSGEEGELWRYGVLPVSHFSKGEREPEVPEVPDASLPLWMEKIAPETTGSMPVSAPRVCKRGIFIHYLLHYLPDLPEGDRLAFSLRYAGAYIPELTSAQHRLFAFEAMAVIDDPRFAAFFSHESFTEVEVFAGEGRKYYRIDRLARCGEEILIAEFKTDKHVPTSVEKIPASYLKQAEVYRAIVSRLFPHLRVRLFFIWTAQLSIMEFRDVEDAALEPLVRKA